MSQETNDNKKKKEPVIYVKPILNYDQIVEIIDERIAILEKAVEEKVERKKNRKE